MLGEIGNGTNISFLLQHATAVGDSARKDTYSIIGATPTRQRRRAAETSTIRADLRHRHISAVR